MPDDEPRWSAYQRGEIKAISLGEVLANHLRIRNLNVEAVCFR